MCLTKKLQLPVLDNTLWNHPGLKISPELVLINLEKLQRQLISADLDPAAYLAPEELAIYHQFKYQKRRIEWLGGRLAAKQAVLYAKRQEPTGSAMREWPVCADEHGRPFFKSLANKQPCLSISHSRGLALAMTVNERDCGLDLQKISEATVLVKEKFCSQSEEQIIASLDLPDNSQATGLTLLWAAKEALRKARGGHPLTGFTAMQLTGAVGPNNRCWLCTLQINSEKHLIPTFFYKDFAIALCVI
ncbi:MAG: 4'-phosphopantetheinyl transferase superfamily protein [Thermodesulfobacteriota bacterium]